MQVSQAAHECAQAMCAEAQAAHQANPAQPVSYYLEGYLQEQMLAFATMEGGDAPSDQIMFMAQVVHCIQG